ncbi:MAG: (Fe-S)-binding protein [Betaproteobacteria bacterium]|nr:MAG: (Fe-S)-binding protein [Betaproteobacteria bacterium]
MRSLQEVIQREAEESLRACTTCGLCAEVCPTRPHTIAASSEAKDLVRGVLALLRNEDSTPAAMSWVTACSGSGECIKACPERVNPRRMLAIAKSLMNRRAGRSSSFKAMVETNRVLVGMQVDPESIKRLHGRQDQRKERATYLFWIGCNMPRTSHLVLTLEDIFGVLGVDLEVIGGSNNCCGIVHFQDGDNETGGKLVRNLKTNVEAFEPQTLLTWCPSCQIQYDDHIRNFAAFNCDVQHITRFLVDRLPLFGTKWLKPIDKKIALHEHAGLDGASENIRKIVSSIPGVSLIDIDQLRNYGYMCSRLNGAPEAKNAAHKKLLEAARAASIDVLVTPYHSCQRDLCVEEENYGFEVKNFVTLLGEALGIERYEDKYKRFRILGNVERIVDSAAPFMEMNRIDIQTARRVISAELLKKTN